MPFPLARCIQLCACLLGVLSSRLITRKALFEGREESKSKMNCEAWKAMRAAYKQPSVPLAATGQIAYNFCRMLGDSKFRVVNDDDDRELYFRCFHEPAGAFRLRTCIYHDPDRAVKHNETHMCKVSLGYVHDGLKEQDGTFYIPLGEDGAEWMGHQWSVSGTLDWSDQRKLKLTSPVHMIYPDASGDDFKLMPNSEGEVDLAVFDKDAQDEQMETYSDLRDAHLQGCEGQNAGVWKGHPCLDVMKASVKKFCDTFGSYNRVLRSRSDRDLEIQFSCTNSAEPDVVQSTSLTVIFTHWRMEEHPAREEDKVKKPHPYAHDIAGMLYDYVDISEPTKFSIEVGTDRFNKACLQIDTEKGVLGEVVWKINADKEFTYS